MSLVPIRIHHQARELAGLLHQAHALRDGVSRCAVLMLNPLGQEAVRVHRLQRVLADRLARAGHDVLRFDYYGAGDSPGDDTDADLAGWIGDVQAAHAELRRSSRVAAVAWFGMRLGASVALLSAHGVDPAPARLVLWEPVFDGVDYLAALGVEHDRALASSYSLPQVPRRIRAERPPDARPDQLLGFGISPAMCEQIAALRPERLTSRVDRIIVLGGESSLPAPWRAACAADGADVSVQPLDLSFDWTSEEAMNGALVPGPVVGAALTALTSVSATAKPHA